MPINIEEIIEKAFEQAFAKALDQTLQNKAEALFKKAFENGSPLSRKLEEKIEGKEAENSAMSEVEDALGTREKQDLEAKFRDLERDKIIVQAWRAKNVKSNLFVPPNKITEYYAQHKNEFSSKEEVKLRMIMIPGHGSDAATQKALAEAVRGAPQ
jgi:hypothetical protein